MTSLTPIKVSVQPLRGGTRRVSLSCACGRTGRVAWSWEPDADVIVGLAERHRQASPRCPHPGPFAGARQ